MTERLSLPDVTLCAADSAYVGLTARAMRRSLEQCAFGDAILFSHDAVEGPFRTVRIPPLRSVREYSQFCLTVMPDHIATRFALVVQWDGFVINPEAWARAFCKYDYIGAAWHGIFPTHMMVGNGGFSLRSRRLLNAIKTLPAVGGYFEDRVICHIHRERLERDFRIRFAPVRVADRFSYEFHEPEAPPFGFHGLQNMWRHVEDDHLVAVANEIDLDKAFTDHLLRLVLNCLSHEREEPAQALYRRIRTKYPAKKVGEVLKSWHGAEQGADDLEALERLVV